MKDYYDAHPDLRFDFATGRKRAAHRPADGGTENSTSGGTKNRTPGGAENSTSRGTPHSTPQGPADGTSQRTMGSTLQGAAYGPLQPSSNRSAEEEPREEEPRDEETSPSSVVTVEVRASAREGDKQIGAASPRDLSAGTLDGTAGASPAAGPAGVKSAPTPELSRADIAMARDVVARLPRWLQPGDDHERWMSVEVIAARIAVGYPPGVLVHELSANPVDHVASKPQFIASRLRKMAPWIPPARPASDRPAALDEARTVDPDRLHRGAAAARAQMKRRQPSAGSVGQEDQ